MLEMNAGTSYLFDAVYKRLAYEETVYLKDLDFSRFNLDDIVSLQNIYNDTIETNAVRSRGITDAMAKAGSVSVAVSFV
jgi:hypothetical protein